MSVEKKHFVYSIWFKLILLIAFFIPSYSQISYDPTDTSNVIISVLSNPAVIKFKFLLPVAKILLISVTASIFLYKKQSSRIFLGYYFLILLIIGIFQNISNTQEYGFVWLIGNTLIMLTVSVFCLYDAIKRKSVFDKIYFQSKRLWIIIPMLFSVLFPYTVNEQNIIKPAFGLFLLTNEAGVTYCMITPVILGMMILFSKGIYKPIFSIISFVGLYFGVMNMLTWFILQNQNWWMGVLHLPLFILSIYSLILCKYEKIKINT
jgi:hypothetical protein